ncbi:class I SAM-dependent methyltransferase [Mesorhizobium sp.]|uniref:class I SAM-dependent methyltransferase n=1 Tax=Mesorhizobium sp. TaxID=1871066 RepID=UPI00338D77A9
MSDRCDRRSPGLGFLQGCGTGSLARQLVAEGADVSGIDPAADAIREAAEALPFDDAGFDIAVMVARRCSGRRSEG